MGIFEILAESKIKEWLSQPKAQKPKTETKPEDSKTYEGYLLDQIRDLIEKAALEKGEARRKALSKINGMEVQLLISLEQSGHFIMAKETEKIILRHKIKYLS